MVCSRREHIGAMWQNQQRMFSWIKLIKISYCWRFAVFFSRFLCCRWNHFCILQQEFNFHTIFFFMDETHFLSPCRWCSRFSSKLQDSEKLVFGICVRAGIKSNICDDSKHDKRCTIFFFFCVLVLYVFVGSFQRCAQFAICGKANNTNKRIEIRGALCFLLLFTPHALLKKPTACVHFESVRFFFIRTNILLHHICVYLLLPHCCCINEIKWKRAEISSWRNAFCMHRKNGRRWRDERLGHVRTFLLFHIVCCVPFLSCIYSIHEHK